MSAVFMKYKCTTCGRVFDVFHIMKYGAVIVGEYVRCGICENKRQARIKRWG